MKLKDLTIGERYAFKGRHGGVYTGKLTGIRQPFERKSYRGGGTFLGYTVKQNDGCSFTEVRDLATVAGGTAVVNFLRDHVVTVGNILSPEADAVAKQIQNQEDYAKRKFAEERAQKLAEALTQATGKTCRTASGGNYPGARYDYVAIPITLAQSLLASIDACGPLAEVKS